MGAHLQSHTSLASQCKASACTCSTSFSIYSPAPGISWARKQLLEFQPPQRIWTAVFLQCLQSFSRTWWTFEQNKAFNKVTRVPHFWGLYVVVMLATGLQRMTRALKPWQNCVAGSLRSANENWIPLCTHSSFYSVGLTGISSVLLCFKCQIESLENVFSLDVLVICTL